jgi:hypothetical protein
MVVVSFPQIEFGKRQLKAKTITKEVLKLRKVPNEVLKLHKMQRSPAIN